MPRTFYNFIAIFPGIFFLLQSEKLLKSLINVLYKTIYLVCYGTANVVMCTLRDGELFLRVAFTIVWEFNFFIQSILSKMKTHKNQYIFKVVLCGVVSAWVLKCDKKRILAQYPHGLKIWFWEEAIEDR